MIICHQQHARLSVLKTAGVFWEMSAPCWQINTRWRLNKAHLNVELWLDNDWADWNRPEEPRLGGSSFFCQIKTGDYTKIHSGRGNCDLSFHQALLYLLSSPARPLNQSHRSYWKEKRHFCCKTWTADCSHGQETSAWCWLVECGDGRR